MSKLLGREAGLVVLTGLFAWLVFPRMAGVEMTVILFWIGLVMGLTHMALYAMLVLGGRRLRPMHLGLLGAVGWLGAFLPPSVGGQLVPGLLGILLPAVGAFHTRANKRIEVALSTLFAYGFPMLGVRWLLVPMVQGNDVLAQLAWQTGALYMALRVLVRILWPGSVEGGASTGPLVHRPVPDAIVGLVEGTTHLRARLGAVQEDGSLDTGAISVRCPVDQVDQIVMQLQGVIGDKPFLVIPGVHVDGQREIVIRPRLGVL